MSNKELIGQIDGNLVVMAVFPFAYDVCEGHILSEEGLEQVLQQMKTFRRLKEERDAEIARFGKSDIPDPYAEIHEIKIEVAE